MHVCLLMRRKPARPVEGVSHGGRKATGLDAASGQTPGLTRAGDFCSTALTRNGTKAGFDLVITRAHQRSRQRAGVASGGAGNLEHMAEVLLAGKADAGWPPAFFTSANTRSGGKTVPEQQGIVVRLTYAQSLRSLRIVAGSPLPEFEVVKPRPHSEC